MVDLPTPELPTPDLPKAPIAASEFFERFLPQAFAAAGVPEGLRDLDVALGVCLEGAGGGEWVVHLNDGRARVEPGSRSAAAFTLVQSVADWRGALWEGRGGAIGRQASAIFRPGVAAGRLGDLGPPPPAALAQMRDLSGLVRLCVTGGDGGDWSIGLQLGPGEIPAEATTTVSLRAEDAAALASGELGPLEAFMGGRIQVAGDVALLLQMQAIQMQVAQAGSNSGSRS